LWKLSNLRWDWISVCTVKARHAIHLQFDISANALAIRAVAWIGAIFHIILPISDRKSQSLDTSQ
jgi:hypothetical protein